MHVRFYVDPISDAPHIYNHGISEAEAEDVLAHAVEDRPGRDDSRVAVGRIIRVIYVPDPEPQSIFVTAYVLRGKPRAVFRRRRRRKGQ